MTDAEKKWEDHCKRVFYLGPPEERIVAMAILKDFKQALREAIEEEIKLLENKEYPRKNMSSYDYYAIEKLKLVLLKMNTVTPK